MGTDIFSYIDRLELIAFFSGYPLVYAFVYFVVGELRQTKFEKQTRQIVNLLPMAYALTASLFLGLLLRNLYPNYSIDNILKQFRDSYLKIWGVAAFLFWIPSLGKKPILSLFHSMVFFLLILKDLFLQLKSSISNEQLTTDMMIYKNSILLNLGCLGIMTLFYFIHLCLKKRKTHLQNYTI